MKYSEQCLWNAVGVFAPNYIKAKEAGVDMNLASCIKHVSEIAFMECETVEYKTGIKKHVGSIIREALLEMHTVGWMTFGEQDEFTTAPSSDDIYTVFGKDDCETFKCCFNRDKKVRSTTDLLQAKLLADELKDDYPMTEYWVVNQTGDVVYVSQHKED